MSMSEFGKNVNTGSGCEFTPGYRISKRRDFSHDGCVPVSGVPMAVFA